MVQIEQYRFEKAPDVMRAIEVCAMLRISRSTLYRCIKYRGLPVVRKSGAFPHFIKADVIKWFKENEI